MTRMTRISRTRQRLQLFPWPRNFTLIA